MTDAEYRESRSQFADPVAFGPTEMHAPPAWVYAAAALAWVGGGICVWVVWSWL